VWKKKGCTIAPTPMVIVCILIKIVRSRHI
jgi:hypothetical protein